MKAGARIGIGVAVGLVAAVSALLGRTQLKSGMARVQESWRARRGGEYSHGGHLPTPKGQEKVEVKELP